MTKRTLSIGIFVLGIAVLLTVPTNGIRAGQVAAPAVRIGNDDIGGVVTGPRGPEAAG
jgi:hypothetical protein